MSEKPILFSTKMIKAILAGRKTQTRRVIKTSLPIFAGWVTSTTGNNNIIGSAGFEDDNGNVDYLRPRYKIGNILWVRETFCQFGEWHTVELTDKNGAKKQKRKFIPCGLNKPSLFFDTLPEDIKIKRGYKSGRGYYKRPSIYMPHAAARIFLRVTGVRVERLQGISEEDAIEEGCCSFEYKLDDGKFDDVLEFDLTARDAYAELWDTLNAERGYSWDTNPWVWVYEFERVV